MEYRDILLGRKVSPFEIITDLSPVARRVVAESAALPLQEQSQPALQPAAYSPGPDNPLSGALYNKDDLESGPLPGYMSRALGGPLGTPDGRAEERLNALVGAHSDKSLFSVPWNSPGRKDNDYVVSLANGDYGHPRQTAAYSQAPRTCRGGNCYRGDQMIQ